MVQEYTFDLTKAAVFGLNLTSPTWKASKNFTIPKWWWVVTWFCKDDLPWVKYDNYSRLLIRYRVIKSLKVSIKDGQENDLEYFSPVFMLWCLFFASIFASTVSFHSENLMFCIAEDIIRYVKRTNKNKNRFVCMQRCTALGISSAAERF